MRKARGVDEVFIPIWLKVRPIQFTIESGRETGRSVPEQSEGVLFQRVPLQITSRTASKRRYER